MNVQNYASVRQTRGMWPIIPYLTSWDKNTSLPKSEELAYPQWFNVASAVMQQRLQQSTVVKRVLNWKALHSSIQPLPMVINFK